MRIGPGRVQGAPNDVEVGGCGVIGSVEKIVKSSAYFARKPISKGARLFAERVR